MKLKMKLGSKKPLQVKGVKKSFGGGLPSWMVTDPKRQKAMADEQRAQQSRSFIPEMWLRDGEDKLVRFRDEGAITSLWVYKFKSRRGRFERVTMPGDDDENLFRDEAGLKPSFVAVYEVIDINGYMDEKTKKRKKNIPRFFVVSQKVYEQLEKIRQKKGGLNRMNIEISRIGAGAQTAYTFMPEDPTPMTAEMKSAERLKSKVPELFAPPSASEQRILLGQMVTDDED